MKMYEAKPGLWLVEGVNLEEHRAAMAGNFEPDPDAFGLMFPHPADATEVWTTKDGDKIKYSELTDRHLKNIVKYLQRYDTPCDIAFPRLWEEVQERGLV